MPDKGWLKVVLEEARREVNSRPEWQRKRVLAAGERVQQPICEPPAESKVHQPVSRSASPGAPTR